MPALKPVMQLYLRMKLRDAEGVEFSADLFSSPIPASSLASEELPGSHHWQRNWKTPTENTAQKETRWSGKITEG